MEANEHQSVTNVDTRDVVDRSCVGDHKTVLHTSIYTQLQKKPISHILGQLWKNN